MSLPLITPNTTVLRPLIAGNWKMHGLRADGLALASALVELQRSEGVRNYEMVLFPPATLIGAVEPVLRDSGVGVGGQDCHSAERGAFTGDVSAAMLADLGCSYVITGHSERRQHHGETDALVKAKATAGLRAGLSVIVCVGETQAERDSGEAKAVILRQLAGSLPDGSTGDRVAIAYEPVWAIGTGLTATAADIADMHATIRQALADLSTTPDAIRLLYGGSVKAANAAEIVATAHVNGVLVGGASLKADEFQAIAEAVSR
jgi:triosephosphate isomerase (TIM)